VIDFGNVTTLRLLFSPMAGCVRTKRTFELWDMSEFDDHAAYRAAEIQEIEDKGHAVATIRLTHARGTMELVYVTSKYRVGARPKAVILCGGNSESLEDMREFAQFHLQNGVHVLMVQFTGYPEPARDFGRGPSLLEEGLIHAWTRHASNTPDEESMMLDGNTALRWLTRQMNDDFGFRCPHKLSVEDVAVEGHSLGTCMAHLLGATNPNLGAVVAVQPLASIGEVGTFAAVNFVGDLAEGWLPRAAVVPLVAPALKLAAHSISELAYKPPSTVPAALRGFNANVGCAMHKAHYCVIGAKRDDLMTLKADRKFKKPTTKKFAVKLNGIAKNARKTNPAAVVRHIEHTTGYHGTPYTDHPATKRKYAAFLSEVGFGKSVQ